MMCKSRCSVISPLLPKRNSPVSVTKTAPWRARSCEYRTPRQRQLAGIGEAPQEKWASLRFDVNVCFNGGLLENMFGSRQCLGYFIELKVPGIAAKETIQ